MTEYALILAAVAIVVYVTLQSHGPKHRFDGQQDRHRSHNELIAARSVPTASFGDSLKAVPSSHRTTIQNYRKEGEDIEIRGCARTSRFIHARRVSGHRRSALRAGGRRCGGCRRKSWWHRSAARPIPRQPMTAVVTRNLPGVYPGHSEKPLPFDANVGSERMRNHESKRVATGVLII
jgi:hypothetical protein